jgi:transcriptional regulator with XRE-family HTH domain
MYTAIMSNKYPTIDIAATGRNIRSLMAAHGIGPVSVCEQFGIGSLQTVYNWMNGRNLPSIDHLYDLSMLLNIRIDDIIVPTRHDGEYSYNGIMLGMAPAGNTIQPTIVSILRNGMLRVS